MADITKCKGNGCPIKEKCYRYKAKAGERQSWFTFVPFNKDTGKCEMFWGSDSNATYSQLKDILKPKRDK